MKSNPISRPRKKRAKTGKMKREPASKYFNRLMSELHKEFPDNSQRLPWLSLTLRRSTASAGLNQLRRAGLSLRWSRATPAVLQWKRPRRCTSSSTSRSPAASARRKLTLETPGLDLERHGQLGYRSPKETGSKEQKYIHHFGKDEDTGKTFEEPELYYVKNKDGPTMMVIMGGDWYIDVDSDGEVS